MIELIIHLIVGFGIIFVGMWFVYFGILIDRELYEKYHWSSGSFYKPFGLLVLIGCLFAMGLIFGWI